MIPHTIRLRWPWEEVVAEEQRCVYRRRFNRPANLDAWERVMLEIDRVLAVGSLELNGQALGEFRPGEYFSCDITAALQPANVLLAIVDPATVLTGPVATNTVYAIDPHEPPGGPIGDVQIAIRVIG